MSVKIEMDNAMNEAGWAFINAAQARGVEVGGKLWNNCKPMLVEAIAVWVEKGGKCAPATPSIPASPTTAPSILEAAAGHMRDRAATYDKPEGERSMGATVQAFKAITGHELTEEQGWLFMICLKLVRGVSDKTLDSQEDLVACCALMGECVARERNAKASL
jgi:hypothetical protein